MQPFDCGFGLYSYKGLSPSPGLAWFAGLDQFAGTLACLLTTLNFTILLHDHRACKVSHDPGIMMLNQANQADIYPCNHILGQPG